MAKTKPKPKSLIRRLEHILSIMLLHMFGVALALMLPFDLPGQSSLIRRAPAPINAVITLVDGEVSVFHDNSGWEQANEGETVSTLSRIRTESGKAIITFDEGSVVRLDNDTEIELLRNNREKIRIRNLQGRTYSRIDETQGLVWQVDAATTKTTALGTAFSVDYDVAQEGVNVTVTDSLVDVIIQSEEGNRELVVEQGHHIQIDLTSAVNQAVTGSLIEGDIGKTDNFLKWNIDEDGINLSNFLINP